MNTKVYVLVKSILSGDAEVKSVLMVMKNLLLTYNTVYFSVMNRIDRLLSIFLCAFKIVN